LSYCWIAADVERFPGPGDEEGVVVLVMPAGAFKK